MLELLVNYTIKQMDKASACSICSSHQHPTRQCRELWSDTLEGFYAGASADYEGEEDDSLNRHKEKYLLDLDDSYYQFYRRSRQPVISNRSSLCLRKEVRISSCL